MSLVKKKNCILINIINYLFILKLVINNPFVSFYVHGNLSVKCRFIMNVILFSSLITSFFVGFGTLLTILHGFTVASCVSIEINWTEPDLHSSFSIQQTTGSNHTPTFYFLYLVSTHIGIAFRKTYTSSTTWLVYIYGIFSLYLCNYLWLFVLKY